MDKTTTILREHKLCCNCLGRMFGMLATGLTNKERGEAIITMLVMNADEMLKKSENAKADKIIEAVKNIIGFKPVEKFLSEERGLNTAVEGVCYICDGVFNKLDELLSNSLRELEKYEFKTFLVGTNVDERIIEREDNLRARFGVIWGESIKSELNREIGKKIKQYFRDCETSFENPHIIVEYSIPGFQIRVNVNPVFIYGRYKKLVRGIPQTKWLCKACKGAGCEKCGFKGKMYETSVEELISEPVIEKLNGVSAKFHGAGREDIDAIMTGVGRPFVLEVKGVKKRFVELETITKLINQHANGKVEVSDLKWTSRNIIRRIKALSKITKKKYRAIVELNNNIIDDKISEAENRLLNTIIQQRTPKRVAHRRSDKLREKQVYSVKIKRLSDNKLELVVDCQGGLYVKELVSGDDGRTKPSLSEILGVEAKCIQLDVLNVDFPDEAAVSEKQDVKNNI
ncbi:MAG: tRNA pseudouridine(54/55) synthase Pus10 [Candidatus Odinarchaeota archaeon]